MSEINSKPLGVFKATRPDWILYGSVSMSRFADQNELAQ
jgi:hypothetical protein